MGKKIDRTGDRYGRLTVTGPSAPGRSGQTRWACLCDCGKSTTVDACNLRTGHTRSCGCFNAELATAMMSKAVRAPIDNGDGTHTIRLSRGRTALIDSDCAADIGKHNWYAYFSSRVGQWYAYRSAIVDGRRRNIAMHRQIMGAPADMEVDHRGGDGLDNRRSNLRLADNFQNAQNVRTPRHNTSGVKGVSWSRCAGKWSARIEAFGKDVHLGLFESKDDARRAREEAAAKLHGEFVRSE